MKLEVCMYVCMLDARTHRLSLLAGLRLDDITLMLFSPIRSRNMLAIDPSHINFHLYYCIQPSKFRIFRRYDVKHSPLTELVETQAFIHPRSWIINNLFIY